MTKRTRRLNRHTKLRRQQKNLARKRRRSAKRSETFKRSISQIGVYAGFLGSLVCCLVATTLLEFIAAFGTLIASITQLIRSS